MVKTKAQLESELSAVQTKLDDITNTSVIFLTSELETLISWTTEKIRVNTESRQKLKKVENNRRIAESMDRNAEHYVGILEKLVRLYNGN